MAASGDLSVDRSAGGGITVRLSGSWSLAHPLPSAEPVVRELETSPPAAGLDFETSGLESWDSAVLTFLVEIEEACADRGVPTHREGLPTGLRRMVELATAVPEKKDARSADSDHANFLARIGTATGNAAEGAVEMVSFLGEMAASVGRMLVGRARFRRVDLTDFIQDCGARALPIVSLISFLVGLILAFVGAIQLEQFGAQIYVANLVGIAMAREMGAMMAGIIMAGRTGAAFAAQLGTMRVNQEIDALQTMGLPSIDFLVLPRMLALCLMLPLLTLYADFVGIIGGGVVAATMLDLSPRIYWDQTVGGVGLGDFAAGLIKSIFFGVLIAFSGCLRGIQCGNSASAVGDAATSAVVTGIVMIIVADALFTVLFNILGV